MTQTGLRVTPLTLAGKPTHSYVQVTPDMAARWLRSNGINRNLRMAKVNQYARDMAEGRWTLSNDDVCFDTDGVLLNGQHRLTAVVRSGQTVLLGIKRNVPRSAMPNIDTGASRTASDVLRLEGESNGALLGAVVKQAILVDSGRIYQDTKAQGVSHGEILEWLETHPAIRDSVRTTLRVMGHLDAPPSALAVTHYLIRRVNGDDLATYYLTQLARRVGEPEGSAVHAVDSRLRENRRHRGHYPTRNFVYLLVKGWNAYAQDRRVHTLQLAPKPGIVLRIPPVAKWAR